MRASQVVNLLLQLIKFKGKGALGCRLKILKFAKPRLALPNLPLYHFAKLCFQLLLTCCQFVLKLVCSYALRYHSQQIIELNCVCILNLELFTLDFFTGNLAKILHILATLCQFSNLHIDILFHFLFLPFVCHIEKVIGYAFAYQLAHVPHLLFGSRPELSQIQSQVATNFLCFQVPIEPVPHILSRHHQLLLEDNVCFQSFFHKYIDYVV